MDILWRGRVAIVLGDLLEAQGHRVEVWAACRQVRSSERGRVVPGGLPEAGRPAGGYRHADERGQWLVLPPCSSRTGPPSRGRGSSPDDGFPLPISAADPSVAALVGAARLVTVAGVWSKDNALAFAARLIETINQ